MKARIIYNSKHDCYEGYNEFGKLITTSMNGHELHTTLLLKGFSIESCPIIAASGKPIRDYVSTIVKRRRY